MSSIPFYEEHAARLADQYESLDFQDVHADLVDLLPAPGSMVLDVGAGSGRDAAWLAAHGHEVVAVAPSDGDMPLSIRAKYNGSDFSLKPRRRCHCSLPMSMRAM